MPTVAILLSPGSAIRRAAGIGLLALLFHPQVGRSQPETVPTPTGDHVSAAPAPAAQPDIEKLKKLLKRGMPTAQIIPVPVSNNVVLLTGTVARAEHIDVVMRIAQSVGGLQIVNALTVGGVPQVQLDIVIVQVKHGLARGIVSPFVESAGQRTSVAAKPETPFTGLLSTKRDGENLLTIIRALREEGLAKVIAQPSLTTMSGTAGCFLAGGEQAIPVPAGLGQVGVQFEEFGTRMNYLPIVLGSGKIWLEVEAETSTPGAPDGTKIDGKTVRGRVTNRAHVNVELEAAQTLVIGGLKDATEAETDLIILVTPAIVGPASAEESSGIEARETTENRLRRLEEEMADLRRELRSCPRGTTPIP
jgi:pilus assembly protein CpaC